MIHPSEASTESGQLNGCRRFLSCLAFLIVAILLLMACCLLTLFTRPVAAASLTPAPTPPPQAIILLIDNSNSMFEMGGVGSDPGLLRLDAARLFLSYLGVDEPDVAPQAGVIFFGSTAVTTIPLTPLTTDEQRAQLFAQIAAPTRMGWTDHLAALEMAQAQLAAMKGEHRPAIILLTDGKPEWAQTPTEAEQAAYIAALQATSAELAEAGISLSIILLANEATAADTDIATLWQPLWQAMSRGVSPYAPTPSGRFYVARTAAELPDIYHDLVVTLTGQQTAGKVLDTAVTHTATASLTVPPGLAQMSLVISKSSPTQTVTIQTADHVTLADDQPNVRRASGNGREEIWIIEQPQPGTWTLQLAGQGQVSVWQDYETAATPTAAPIPISPTFPAATLPATQSPAATATSLPAEMAAPIIIDTAPPATPTEETGGNLPRWPWLLLGLLLLGAGTAVFFRHQQVNQPTVAGMLRLLGNAQTDEGYTVIDLDSLDKRSVVIGRAPADIPLPGALAQAVIRPGAAIAVETYEMRIKGRGELWLKGRPLTGEATLFDAVVINFGGGVQARYENLRLRRAEREMGEMRN
jgi:hypothetical protein